MDREISKQLKASGLERYEISNYALTGFRARHNSGYWKFKPYIGLGPGASSYNGMDIRRSNPPNLKDYINHFLNSDLFDHPFYEEEVLDKTERMTECLMVSLRCREGVDFKAFKENFGHDRLTALLQKSERFVRSGDMILEENRLHLSDKGISISDFILQTLI